MKTYKEFIREYREGKFTIDKDVIMRTLNEPKRMYYIGDTEEDAGFIFRSAMARKHFEVTQDGNVVMVRGKGQEAFVRSLQTVGVNGTLKQNYKK